MENRKWKLPSWNAFCIRINTIRVENNNTIGRVIKEFNAYEDRCVNLESEVISLLDEMQRELEWLQSMRLETGWSTVTDRITTLTALINKFI